MPVSLGFAHSCFINKNGEIQCFGLDNENQVSNTPTNDTYNFISSGFYHNCAISSTTFKITCWGNDDQNQVSDPNAAELEVLWPLSCPRLFLIGIYGSPLRHSLNYIILNTFQKQVFYAFSKTGYYQGKH